MWWFLEVSLRKVLEDNQIAMGDGLRMCRQHVFGIQLWWKIKEERSPLEWRDFNASRDKKPEWLRCRYSWDAVKQPWEHRVRQKGNLVFCDQGWKKRGVGTNESDLGGECSGLMTSSRMFYVDRLGSPKKILGVKLCSSLPSFPFPSILSIPPAVEVEP